MPTLESITFDALYTLMKGEPGTRKSTCALSYPRPQYWFSFDKKMEGLIRPMKAWGIPPSEIEYDDYKEWNSALKKIESLQVNCKYKTIIIDSVTSCGDTINRQTLKSKQGQTTTEGKAKGGMVGGIPVNSIEDYKAEESALSEMVFLTKDISKYHKVNVILIAHIIQKEMKSADGQTHMARILVTAGKGIAQKIPAYCTEVYHFNVKNSFQGGKYGLLTTHTGDDFARTSLPLPPEITFDDKPLYSDFIRPAVDEYNKSPLTVTPIPPQTKPTFNTTK